MVSSLRIAGVVLVVLSLRPQWMSLGAQQAPATKDCAHVLELPQKDSVTMRVLLDVHAIDREHDIPDWFQEDVVTAVRTVLRVPRPFGISAYETDWERPARTAHPAVRSVIRAVITRDGRIRDAHVIGGVRNDAMDAALLAALQRLDSTGTLVASAADALTAPETPVVLSMGASVPGSAGEHARRMRAEWGITVSAGFIDPPSWAGPPAADSAVGFPLFFFRTPLLSVTREPVLIPGADGLRYPGNLRKRGGSGDAAVAFVVGADGRTERGTPVVVAATHPEFVQAVLNALPGIRFKPLEVEGCAVRSFEQVPFAFRIAK